MTCSPNKNNTPTRPSLTVDWEVYAAMLEDSDMPLDQQKELIETLWSIVVNFVDLGYEIKPSREICGEGQEVIDQDSADLVSLLNNDQTQILGEEDQWRK